MFEGKHIHFSPSDNKPLCSFSNKLCRQRRLNGYAFCIRHILEDKSAPFKRCTYVTRNNNQVCLNAIPTNQERGYCHSHMQVAGIIPKTERKLKNPLNKGETAGGISSNNKGDLSTVSSNNVKKDPNAVFKFEEEHSEIQWIPKGGSINGLVNGGKTATGCKGKDLHPLSKKELNGEIPNGSAANGAVGQVVGRKNGKINQTNHLNGVMPAEKGGEKNRLTYSKKCAAKNSSSSSTSNINNGQLTSCVRDPVKELNKPKEKKIDDELNAIVVPRCLPGHETYFEQLKTLKSVEKTVIKTEESQQNDHPSAVVSSSIDAVKLVTQTMSIPRGNNNNNNQVNTTIGIHGFESLINCKAYKAADHFWNSPETLRKSSETRQEFLARVRQAFKYQYLTIKNSTKESEKNEKIWKRALRNSLISCVVKDSSFCAHVLVQNDPLKYSDVVVDVDAVSKTNGTTTDNSSKHKKAPLLNGFHVNKKGKIEAGKNGMIEKGSVGSPHEIKNQQVIIDKSKTSHSSNGSLTLTTPPTKLIDKTPSVIDKKPKSKASKRSTGQTPSQTELPGSKKTLQATKRKLRKSANTDLLNRINGMQNTPAGTEKAIVSSTSLLYKNNKESFPVNAMNGLDGISSSVINKKRKFDSGNGIDKNAMDESSTFRIPKLEESSSNFNNIDIKMENGHLLNSSYNAHLHLLSNHSLFHPHTSTTNPSMSSANLQHILSQPDLRTLASHRNQGMDTVLNSVGSSDMGTSDGVITDASFDSTFDHSTSSQQDCEFSDDDLEKSLEFQIDPETEHQASRLLEENEITEDDLNELFPETRIGDNKLGRSSDLSDLGIDFASTFDVNDLDYFANIFPFTRTNQSESISVTNQF